MLASFPGLLGLVALAAPAEAQDIKVLTPQADRQDAYVAFAPRKAYDDPVKVGIVRGTQVSQAGGTTLIQKYFDPLCELPCAVALPPDHYEFHFRWKKQEWTKKIKIPPGQHQLSVRPVKPGALWPGVILTSTGVGAPIGLPLWLIGAPSHKLSPTDAPPVEGASGPPT